MQLVSDVDDKEIYRTARRLIDTYGPRVAWQHAMIKAFEQADPAGLPVWARIVDAIDELTRVRRRAGETVQ